MGELISGFLGRPKNPLGIGHSGNPHVPWCCSSCSRLWLISGPWKFSLCTDLIQKVLFISQILPLPFSFLFADFSPCDRVQLFSLLSLHITDPSSVHHTCTCLSLSFPVCSSLMGAVVLTLLGNFPFRLGERGAICLMKSSPEF